MFDYAGALHIHSSYSYDAHIPVQVILDEARKTNLRFVMLTDHFSLEAREAGWEGYYPRPADGKQSTSDGRRETGDRRILVIVGEEISPRYNHYLALQIEKPIVVSKEEAHPQGYIDEVNNQGGFGFISHPDHPGAPLIGSRAYPWIAWDAQGYAGLGLWDLISDWVSSLRSPWATLYACLRPGHVLKGPFRQTLARWDELTQKGHIVAIGELDNHGNKRSYFGLKRRIFPFSFAFRTIRTHVLLKEPLSGTAGEDQKRVLAALREGRSYISLDLWNNPAGFTFVIYNSKERAWPGGEITRQGPTLVEAKLPVPGRLRLIHNGRVVREERKRSSLIWDINLPGVYRIEADQHIAFRWRPWIFSNPIWVR